MTIFKKENSQNERRSIKNNEITQKILSDTSYQTANDFEVFQGKINKTKIHSKCLEN